MIITSMNMNHSYGSFTAWGEWLDHQLRSRNMSQEDFADKVGVAQGTVSRWVKGRRPAGKYIDLISDVLMLDYNIVATKAGYRPRTMLEIDPDGPVARLVPLIERIDWTQYPERLDSLVFELELMIKRGRSKHKED